MRSVVRLVGSIVAGAAVIALLGETPLGAQAAGQGLGSVNVSQKVMANGQPLEKGTYTVFAPTNAAFAKVPKSTLAAVAKDPALLQKVLTYHVVKGKAPAAKVVTLNGKSVKTLEGQAVKISIRGGKVYLNGSTRVTKTNVMASNGVIHVIDRVLIPTS